MKPTEWITGHDTGISSKTIWAVMMDAIGESRSSFDFDVPHDPSDFGRCYRLLQMFPEWKARLNEVAKLFPKWGPMVREWDKMAQLYERDFRSGRSSELYDLIKKLEDEGRLADGWKKTGSNSWEKEHCHVVNFTR